MPIDNNSLLQHIGVVVIGRNEGDRLLRGLTTLQSMGVRVVYVDSASSDGSAQRVRTQFPDFAVLELTAEEPMSAARARNAGARAWQSMPHAPRFLQFVDGDCVVLPGWLETASSYLDANTDCAAVLGPLQEMYPQASIYNQLCALEWASAIGEIQDCGAFGGLSMVRAKVFHSLGGFNASVIAGEDSEFAVRMKLAGHRVVKLPTPMAQHDAGMTRFSEFWTRAIRSGHAIGQRFDLHGRGPEKDCAKDLRSVKIWGIGLPLAALALGLVTGGWGLLLWPAGMAWLHLRVASYRQRTGDDPRNAHIYAASMLVTKYAQVIGLVRYWMHRREGQFRLIEYK